MNETEVAEKVEEAKINLTDILFEYFYSPRIGKKLDLRYAELEIVELRIVIKKTTKDDEGNPISEEFFKWAKRKE